MGININNLNCNLNFNNQGRAENICELTEQELRTSGGGTGTFSKTVTDRNGKTVLDENTTFETGFAVNDNFDVPEEEDLTTFLKPRTIPIYYPSIVGFGYISEDDSEEEAAQ